MNKNTCLVWTPLNQPRWGAVEMPVMISSALDNAPIYTHNWPEEIINEVCMSVIEFRNDSLFSKIISETPFDQLYINNRYATWKPPEKYNVLITNGPKPIHTVQRLSQRHIHAVDGSYRGFFLHKDKYSEFQEMSDIKKFIIGMFRLYYRTAIQASMKTVDTLIVNSEWTRDVVDSLFNRDPDKIIYPPVAVESYSLEYKNHNRDSYYLYLGQVDRLHRIFESVRAFNNLPYSLKIAGTGKKMAEAKNLAQQNIEFCGYVDGDQKRRLLANAKALVNPTNHSFGRSVIESLASGRPVITLDKGYPPYVINHGDNGLIYQQGVSNLRDAIEEFENEGVSESNEDLIEYTYEYKEENLKEDWRELVT